MKSYKEITYRYLKGQRNRTLLTILGIILSVAMVTAVGTILLSTREALIKEAISENGTFHARFRNLEKEDVEKVVNHVGIDEAGISKYEGLGIVSQTTEKDKELYGEGVPPYRYISIESYTKEALDLLPYTIGEGRFPENSYEIAIDPSTVKYFEEEVKIGDKIKLDVGDRKFIDSDNGKASKEIFEKINEREYEVVGFLESKIRWSGNFETKGITSLDENSPKTGKYNVYFTLPSVRKANDNIFSIAKDVGVDGDNILTNYRLLRLSAESLNKTFNNSLMALVAFIIILIMVSTIAVIYNSFNISVLERISQFGLLRSVGATPSQIKGIVLKESLILSAIGIPIGLISGLFGMKVVFYIISAMKSGFLFIENMDIVISVPLFLFCMIIGLITVFLSAIGPARRAGKISPLEAVRNTGSFKKESFDKIKRSRLIKKFFGIEGEIAYKNLRRNRKRFIITVFSMVISISLFITFSTFSDFMFKMGVVEKPDVGDFVVYGQNIDNIDAINKGLKEVNGVNMVYKLRSIHGEALIQEDKVSKQLIEQVPNLFSGKVEGLNQVQSIMVYSIGDENMDILKDLLKSGNINKEELDKNNGVLVINNTYAYNEKTDKFTFMEGYHFKVGDKIQYASYANDKKGAETKYTELNVAGILDKGVLGEEYSYNSVFNIITTDKVLNNLEIDPDISNPQLIIEMTKDADLEPIRNYLDELEQKNPDLRYVDYAEQAKENRDVSIIMSIFLYGFVTLITLISSINIINTISTNIILRTKEIAMIKAVGMTQSGIKRMVALESIYYGLYAAIFGGALGTSLTYILFKIVFNIREFQWVMPWRNIVIACIGATIVALLSGIYPLKRISEGIIVENIKSEN